MSALRDAVLDAQPVSDGVQAQLLLRFRRGERGKAPPGGGAGRPGR